MGIYKWKSGTRFKSDVQEVGKWLENIEERTPENIVEQAKSESCPAHECFTWDEKKAAKKWNIQEARMLVNAIITVSESDDREDIEFPAFESVIIGDSRQYVSTTVDTLTDDDLWNQIAGEARSSIASLQRKLKVYSHMRNEQADIAQHHLDLARDALAI